MCKCVCIYFFFTLGASVRFNLKMRFSIKKCMKDTSLDNLKGHQECVKCEYKFVCTLE